MLTDLTITANDVAQAAEEMNSSRKAWERFGFRIITDKEWNEAGEHVSQGVLELQQYYSLAWRKTQIKFGLCRLIAYTGIATWGWLVGGLMAGTAAVVLAAVPLVLAFGHLLPVFVGLAVCFLLIGSATAAILFLLGATNSSEGVDKLRAQLKVRTSNIAVLEERLQGWGNHLSLLRQVRRAQDAYALAFQRHDQMVKLLNSRRYQLVHSDWRALRGIAFEDFVAEIFAELGYTVQKTKASGDQGVDLIVRGRGRAIAVQTKGYSGSVGNKAIQEVYAGMTFYSCQECLAVTNSHFTSSANALARSVGCSLIDGRNIPQLVEGKLY